jgi:cytochrome c-type biogenesis protein CcmH/NrfF
MAKELLKFESKKEKYAFFGIVAALVILVIITFFPVIQAKMTKGMMELKTVDQKTNLMSSPKTASEYYDMFQCSCCGKTIAADCCGMAKQRKAYVDELLLEGLEENELVYMMVKTFGFDILMDQSKEAEIRDYIKSKAPDNPPEIYIENPRYDFGTVSQADGIVSTTFTIKNTGKGDLTIDNMDSSCMCTTASLTYKGVEGPIFGMSMHGDNPKDYSLAIPPGESAQLKVYFDPMAHGKQEKPEMSITREVTIISNDPVDFQTKVRIELIQVP